MDLLLQPEQLQNALDAARYLRYEPIPGTNDRVDHLPTMIRKTGWQWRGDLFDPDIPVSLELHFRLWNQETEHFEPSGLDQFWERRERRQLEALSFTALHPVDAMAYSSLHLLRHLLRGDVKPFHVYELGCLLDRSADNDSFWATWQHWHDPSLRRIQAICFSLAQRWFDGRLSPAASEEIASLAPDVTRWLDMCAFSPLGALVHPNKDELWLHWSLIGSQRARWSMLRRRLLPESLPGLVDAVHVPDREVTLRLALRRRWTWLRYATSRATHHLRALPAVVNSAVQWFSGLESQYWTFFLAAALFNFGLMVFFFLYNLYLLQLGFREDFLGLISSVMTAGSLAGCIPAAAAIRRFGMRSTLLGAFVAIACISAIRATVTPAPLLVALAFLAGFVGSTWGVAISPTVAGLTTERNRALGFSLIFSSGVGIGVLGGFAGGLLPGRFAHLLASNINGYRASLLFGCLSVLLALWPLSRLKIQAAPQREPVFTRPSPLLWRFFAAVIVWNLGTGAFNPFFSAFFVHLRLSTERIGALFSSVHFAQAFAMLAAPIAIRRLGLTRGISTMQFATAASLAALAIFQGPGAASLGYGAYMMAQYMSEPGVFALLMNSVPIAQRAGLSALNMMVIFGSQAAAAGVSGVLITRFGYPSVLVGASLICAAAALLFRTLGAERIVPSES
jgi:predicted MFS family arabinose efflux permease